MITDTRPSMSADDILSRLLEAKPERTAHAPRNSRGIYGLVDHHGTLRYIGSTASTSQTFYERIHQRHRTGSEDGSHYFSRMYNTGRMWRARNHPPTQADGKIAKALRNAFIAEHCRAVWVPLPNHADIVGLEVAVVACAPIETVAWNRRETEIYAEPEDLVDHIITGLGFGPAELDALVRQKRRYEAASAMRVSPALNTPVAIRPVPPFPSGPFRFFALDVETANHDRASICQIGVACIRPDNSVETWVTYVDPQVDHWAFTWLHGIDARTVRDAPRFDDVLKMLAGALRGHVVYQHSGFDRSAVRAACQANGHPEPDWDWKDSVQVARRAWPELKGNGGHGLASLKKYFGLTFEHHDAGEDARAAAEVVLLAEAARRIEAGGPAVDDDEDDLIEEIEDMSAVPTEPISAIAAPDAVAKPIGQTVLTAGNIANNHIYLCSFFDAFPKDAVGGSNIAAAADKTILVDWGGECPVVTDLDGTKKLFRKRGWIRDFFERTAATAGDLVEVEMIAPYRYQVSLRRA